MRRKDREVTDKKEMLDFLSSQQIMRVAFSDNGDVYIVPLNYGYTISGDKLTMWFHGAKSGRKYSLAEKAHPMFGRSEHCPGIVYDEFQHNQNREKGYPTNFLYFDSEQDGTKYADYLSVGISEEIPSRFKCRTRKPWYKVPSVFSTPVNMLKRSNGMPRLILNRLKAFTTDTAYRITPKDGIDAATLVTCFLNSVTALSAELEGRFYGGGVLELVPSEIERLLVPYIDGAGSAIDDLNMQVRELSVSALLTIQDEHLFSNVDDIDFADIVVLHKAFLRLQFRRQRITTTE